jgi:hypothetical protein
MGGSYDEVQYRIPTKVFMKKFKFRNTAEIDKINSHGSNYDGSVNMDYDTDDYVLVHGGS